MEELSLEEMGDFVGDSVRGVIWKIERERDERKRSEDDQTRIEGEGEEETKSELTSEIGSRLVRATGGTTRLPSRNVDGLEVLGHLSDLNRVETEENRREKEGESLEKESRGDADDFDSRSIG